MSKQNIVKKYGINLTDPSTFQVEGLSGFNTKPIVFAVGNSDGLLIRVIHKPVKPTALNDQHWVLSSYEELQYMRSEGENDPLASLKRKAKKHLVSLILCHRYPDLISVVDNEFVLSDGSKIANVLNEARNESDAKWRSELPVHQRKKFEGAPPKRPKMPEVVLLASVPEKYRNLAIRYMGLMEEPNIKNLFDLIPGWDIRTEAVKNPFEQTVQKPIFWAKGMTEAQVRGSIARIIADGTCAGGIRDKRGLKIGHEEEQKAVQTLRAAMKNIDKVEGEIRGLLSTFTPESKSKLQKAIQAYQLPPTKHFNDWKDDKIEKSRMLREAYLTEYHHFQEKLKASALARDKYRNK